MSRFSSKPTYPPPDSFTAAPGTATQHVPHDRPEQLTMMQEGLMPGETLLAVYDCIGVGTGFVGLTDRRLILQDKSFIGKKVAITSVPYKNVRSVSVVSDKALMKWGSTSSIAVDVGGTPITADFRGEQKAHHVHSVILHHICG